jgi:hypothetical protein
MLAFGGLMVLIMVLRPTGLVGFRRPTIRMADQAPPMDGAGQPRPALGKAPG